MIKGLWDSGAGMMARGLQHELTANNLANLSTTAFKEDRLSFREMIDGSMLLDRNRGSANPMERLSEGATTVFQEGAHEETGNSLDFAIEGPGFFVLREGDKEIYSRSGHLQRSPEGELMGSKGLPVLGEGGPITLGPGPVQLMSDGSLVQNEEVMGKLRLVEIDDVRTLGKLGDGLYQLAQGAEPPVPATLSRLHQGRLESANVNPVTQMVRMIEQQRSYQFAQRALQAIDQNLGKAVGELGRLPR
jgi:flagellar basal-body rod protein FlgF